MSDAMMELQEQRNQELALAELDKELRHIQLEYEIFGGPAYPKAEKDPNDQYDDQADTDPGEVKDQEHFDCHGN